MRRPVTKLIVLLAATATVAGGCGQAVGSDSAMTTEISTAVPTPTASTPSSAKDTIEIAQVVRDVEFYGACGNETASVGSTVYYQLLDDERDALEPSRYPLDEPTSSAGFARVVEPGPGDDIGTMIVYSDGMARFTSDSGTTYWLTSEERIYNWVC